MKNFILFSTLLLVLAFTACVPEKLDFKEDPGRAARMAGVWDLPAEVDGLWSLNFRHNVPQQPGGVMTNPGMLSEIVGEWDHFLYEDTSDTLVISGTNTWFDKRYGLLDLASTTERINGETTWVGEMVLTFQSDTGIDTVRLNR